MERSWVYIMTNYNRNVLYIGVTTDLVQRLIQHRLGEFPGFTAKYKCKYLLYFEEFTSVTDAIHREKQLKNWKRIWKLELIEKLNPTFDDAYSIRGSAYQRNGQFDQAISDFSQAIEINPNDAMLYYNRGNAYSEKGLHNQAISDYEKAIELNQEFAIAYIN